MSTELTDKEAQALFSQISGALKENDTAKLDDLFTVDDAKPGESTTEEDVNESSESVDLPEDTPEDDSDTEETEGATNDEGAKEKDPPSSTKTEDGSADEEPDELASLRTQLEQLKQDKEKADKEIHHFRSQAGRMKAMNRNMKKYDERLEELQRQIASPSNRPSASVLEKVKGKFKAIEDIDPELAALLESTLSEAIDGVATDNLNREKETVSLLRDREVAEYEASEAERLLSMYSNAAEVFNSPSWKEWKKAQPAGIVALAESSNADEVAAAFEMYSGAIVKKHPELQPTQTPVTPTQPVNLKAQEIEKERQRKKVSNANVNSPNAQGKVSLPDDPQALFDKYYESVRKQISG